MTDTLLRLTQAVLAGALFLSSAASPGDRPAGAPAPDVAAGAHNTYIPFQAGRTLTYQTSDGSRFSLTFQQPITVRWFDGSERRLVPATDTQCNCQVLFRDVDGEIRVVGTIQDGRIEQWGEYMVVRFAPATGKGRDFVRVEVKGT